MLVDQYLHPRSFAVAFILFALVNTLDRRFVRAGIWVAAAACISPLMAMPGALFALTLAVKPSALERIRPASNAMLAAGVVFRTGASLWDEVAPSYFYLSRWRWYEILGVIGPLVILYVMSRLRPANTLPSFSLVCRRIVVFGFLFAILSLVLCAPQFERFLALQPMRSFHLVYLILILCCGGLIGDKILKNKPLRWVLFFLPFCLMMFCVQRDQFSASDHIEWPGMKPRNEWVQAFQWISRNTPTDAFFALDPYYMESEGEDFHSFRAIAERSMMPDLVKDPAIVSVLSTATKLTSDNFINSSEIAAQWRDKVEAVRGWKDFGANDFHQLSERFGVNWVVLAKPDKSGLPCVYENSTVKVCHLQ